MGLFGKRESPNMQPLVNAPKGGDAIVFDDEEQQAVDEYVHRQFETQFKGQAFSEETTEKISRHFAAEVLRKVAERRLNQNDLKGAASTGLKILGITLQILPSDYLRLAKIFALHGDAIKAKNFISAANKTFKDFPQDELSKQGWKITLVQNRFLG